MEDRSPSRPDGPADGLREQLAAVYDAHAAGLYRYAVMVLADAASAEDAVQQTFTKLIAGGRIAQVASQRSYLRSAVRNECYRILRRKRPRAEADAQQAILEPVDGRAIDAERRDRLEQALRALPGQQREVVHMRVYEQMTFQRVADELGVSINTVASRWRYAMDKLRQLLAPYWRDEGEDK